MKSFRIDGKKFESFIARYFESARSNNKASACCIKHLLKHLVPSNANMREIVHVQAGQCGNQIGAKFWEVSIIMAVIERSRGNGGGNGEEASRGGIDPATFLAYFFPEHHCIK